MLLFLFLLRVFKALLGAGKENVATKTLVFCIRQLVISFDDPAENALLFHQFIEDSGISVIAGGWDGSLHICHAVFRIGQGRDPVLQDVVALLGQVVEFQQVLPGARLLVLAEIQEAEVIGKPDPADSDDLEAGQGAAGSGIFEIINDNSPLMLQVGG